MDSAVGGSTFGAVGSPSLLDVLVDVLDDIPYPGNRKPLFLHAPFSHPPFPFFPWFLSFSSFSPFIFFLFFLENQTILETWNPSRYTPLGSGSDYTVFIDHLGIPRQEIFYLIPFLSLSCIYQLPHRFPSPFFFSVL